MAAVVACHSCVLGGLGMADLDVVEKRAAEAPCCPSAVAEDDADHGDLTVA